MKRLVLAALYYWRDARVFAAEIHAHSAQVRLKDAGQEYEAAIFSMTVFGDRLAEARRERARAGVALARHDRHRELGKIVF